MLAAAHAADRGVGEWHLHGRQQTGPPLGVGVGEDHDLARRVADAGPQRAALTGVVPLDDAHTLVTNRHVLAGASLLELSTWDGRTLPVQSASVSRLGYIGIDHVDRRLPQVLTLGGRIPQGSSVTAVGYPLGGELRLLPGVLVDEVSGAPFGIPGRVMRLTTAVQHGNSGGPLLDPKGRVVGVIFAIEIRTRLALAIPVSTLRHLVATRDLAALPPCGSE